MIRQYIHEIEPETTSQLSEMCGKRYNVSKDVACNIEIQDLFKVPEVY